VAAEYDLIVIGGGPAGTATAITAGRAGIRVLLLERGRFPRDKVCGEFVSAESLALLASLLSQDGGETDLLRHACRIMQARVFLGGQELHAAVEPAAASITRFDLDYALWQAAQAAGAECRQGVEVQEIAGRAPFVLRTSAGEMLAHALVNACGRWSRVSAQAQAETPMQKRLGLKAHFVEASPPASVDLYFFEGGYCGVQPVGDGRINVCAMVNAEVAADLPQVFLQHAELRQRASAWTQDSHAVTTAPLVFRPPRPVQNRVLCAGDTAGFVDPFVGDGISLALRSGALAARCVTAFVGGPETWEQTARRYQAQYNENFGSVFRNAGRVRTLLTLPRVVRGPVLRVLSGFDVAERILRATRAKG
jgi:flavin-dependent dehydrogenase